MRRCLNTRPDSRSLDSSLIAGDVTNELVRHFLIESSPKGVKLKGCPNEPYFGQWKLPFSFLKHTLTAYCRKGKSTICMCVSFEDLNPFPSLKTSNPAVIIVLTDMI